MIWFSTWLHTHDDVLAFFSLMNMFDCLTSCKSMQDMRLFDGAEGPSRLPGSTDVAGDYDTNIKTFRLVRFQKVRNMFRFLSSCSASVLSSPYIVNNGRRICKSVRGVVVRGNKKKARVE